MENRLDPIDCDLTSLFDLSSLSSFTHLVHLNVHGNGLRSIDNLSTLVHLRSLVLSANLIENIGGLDALRSLEYLNLAANRIRTVEHVEGLGELRKLILAHNQITDIGGLAQDRFQKNQPKLEYLDLKDNAIAQVEQLNVLAGAAMLKELILQCHGKYSIFTNPICNASIRETVRSVWF